MYRRIACGTQTTCAPVRHVTEVRERVSSESRTILRKLNALWPAAELTCDLQWSGAFGKTADGLPLVGGVTAYPGIFAAYGYGGNGITFSFLASRMIERMIAGLPEHWYDDFALDRPAPAI